MKPSDRAGGPGDRSAVALARHLTVIVGLTALIAVAVGPARATDQITVSGSLSRFVGNPSSGPDGKGLAVFTISSDRTQLAWTITYAGVSSPITHVYFCAGSNPPVYPIGDPCAFVMSEADGGSSPITGSRSILGEQAEALSSGWAYIELDSADGPQLAGYIRIGPPVPNMATVEVPASDNAATNLLVALTAGIGAFVYVMAVGARRPGVATVSVPRRRTTPCSVGRPGPS